jgi:hypothetical protein
MSVKIVTLTEGMREETNEETMIVEMIDVVAMIEEKNDPETLNLEEMTIKKYNFYKPIGHWNGIM